LTGVSLKIHEVSADDLRYVASKPAHGLHLFLSSKCDEFWRNEVMVMREKEFAKMIHLPPMSDEWQQCRPDLVSGLRKNSNIWSDDHS
jgi:hypothetical protein